MSAEPAMLELRGLDVAYGGVAAVRDLSLEVRRGEIVGLIGPNGAGKSTTLHAIMGLVPARAGRDPAVGAVAARVARRRASLSAAWRSFPRAAASSPSSASRRTCSSASRGGASRDGVEADIASVYELFPIVEEFRRRPAGALSGGQQQQLAIARALVARTRRAAARRAVARACRRPSSTSCSRRCGRSATAG